MSQEDYVPQANVAKELSEISKDFTHPRELIREALSNSIDASASTISIEAFEDESRGEKELYIKISDDGIGMDNKRLKGFFDLGNSTKQPNTKPIGYKGHGTKIAYNSAKVCVTTKYLETGEIHRATLNEPKRELNLAAKNNLNPPVVVIENLQNECVSEFQNMVSGTTIEIWGYDNSNIDAFAHGPLKDYIRWYTAWGCVANVFGINLNPPCVLKLKGIGEENFEEIPYGHLFPSEMSDFKVLRQKDDRRPENFFVKRWVSEDLIVNNYPNQMIRVIFSTEGDSAKRESNEMLKRIGRTNSNVNYKYSNYRYNVSDRYGIYFCKDYIPIERKNETFTSTSEWTKWHAFVNCQGFNLTANRSSVENTNAGLLDAIKKTAIEYLENTVFDSSEYVDFKERLKNEEGRRKADKEKKDVKRRNEQYKAKKKFRLQRKGETFEFLEPRSEQGVLWLLAKVTQIWPDIFPWIAVLDIDSHFGYDLLVHKRDGLTEELLPAFVELKYELRDQEDFNHSFEYLSAIVCWQTRINHGDELVDIQGKKRCVCITNSTDEIEKTTMFLTNQSGGTNIEVVVLEKLFDELLDMKKIEKN